jgi:hypothetical protein
MRQRTADTTLMIFEEVMDALSLRVRKQGLRERTPLRSADIRIGRFWTKSSMAGASGA